MDDPKTYLWERICRLVRERKPGNWPPSVDEVQSVVGVGRGTVQRIREGEAATRLSSLTTIAQHLGMPVWQLLLPESLELLPLSPRAIEVGRVYDSLPPQKQRLLYLQVQLTQNPDAEPASLLGPAVPGSPGAPPSPGPAPHPRTPLSVGPAAPQLATGPTSPTPGPV